ncbi:histidine phosphatase family protein [Candidatus Woesearchaeota archaeon]|jgi:broad specificity phosphatase PhoE|nr:histidine phosphatase family protein [Candidatus Woesearchaeota archaeon]MBT5272381.1 histidine phosphatase family protein [Candidatus Woesearchaeota archaeon]MBT6040992.1 histidine phosphatase family protein [Candidatus Woesearchaeota archaeon]MBT6336653.1 histidine phosphatase family protein [Candidatus Woesearchaeota archaeon]MBT7927543.1 histidine phosphatase family protein [Candidatus Woesearchaeota archaeon]
MTLEIYLVRHGETESNLFHQNKISGQSNWAELTTNGVNQAKTLGQKFLMDDLFFEDIYCSPSVRTQQTTRYCLDEMHKIDQRLKYDNRLMEQDQGDWVGKLKSKIYSREDVKKGLNHDNWNFVPGDLIKGESQAKVAARMYTWLEEIITKQNHSKILAVSHGLAIRYLIAEVFDLDRKTAYKIPIDNTSITKITYNNEKYILVGINDTKHLEKSNIKKVKATFDDSSIKLNV